MNMEMDVKGIRKLVKKIRTGKPPAVAEGKFEDVYRHPLLPGFGIRVLHTGAAIWSVHWKRLGRQGKVSLGDVRVLDEPQALEAARDVLAKIQLRILDPQAAKREAMRANKVTFESLVPLFLEHKTKRGLRGQTLRAYERYLTGDYFGPLHKLPVDEISKGQISTQLDRITTKNGGQAAWSSVSPMKGFFKWAIRTGKLPEGHKSPMADIEEPEKSEPRARVLTNDEIRTIWKTCEAWEAEVLADDELQRRTGKRSNAGKASITDFSRAVRLLFLTGCRAQEIGDLVRSECDLEHGEIKISKDRYKTKFDFHNPLADMAVEILRSVPKRKGDEFFFGTVPGKGLDMTNVNRKLDRRIARAGRPARDPMQEQMVRDMLVAGLSQERIRKEAHINWRDIKKIKARMADGTPIPEMPVNPSLPHWTIHDIRRTVRSKLAECGVPGHIAARLIGHRSPKDLDQSKVDQGYDRYEYWPEKRAALVKLQDKLRAIVDGTVEKIVTPKFGRRA
jgi:integrase